MKIGIIGAGPHILHLMATMAIPADISFELISAHEADIYSAYDYLISSAYCPLLHPSGTQILPSSPIETTISLAAATKKPLIHISSGDVHDASNSGSLITEASIPTLHRPLAQNLWAAEEQVRQLCPQHLILRIGPVISTAISALPPLAVTLQHNTTLGFDDHARFYPTPIHDVVRVIVAIVRQLDCGAARWGTYHYQSSDGCTWYQFAEAALAVISQYCSVNTVLIEQTNGQTSAAELSCQKLLNTFGIKQRPWRASITGMIREVLGIQAGPFTQPSAMSHY